MPFEINMSGCVKAVLKAIIWGLWNVGSGLAPFLVVVFIASTLLDKPAQATSMEEINHLRNDLVVLFFCSAMMGEVTIEAFLSKIKFGKYTYLGFCVSSFSILGLVCILYSIIVSGNHNSKPFNGLNNMATFQTIVILFSLIYCIFIKSVLLYEDEKLYNKCLSQSTI